jgi:glycosyltransferase involved in cell wall biosynthesis
VRATYTHAAMALANTHETAARMNQLGAARVKVMGESALANADLGGDDLRMGPGSEAPAFLVAARLLHWKGVHLALRALARCRSHASVMNIVGAGPERDRLIALAAELGLNERVRFHGQVPRADVLRMLQSSRALVHASLHDSGGWVCLEAMAAGVPVICLDLGGPATQVTAATGFRVAAISPDQAIADISSAMDRLCSDLTLAKTLGEAGRRRARDHFTWEEKAEQFEAIYRMVV